MFHFSGLQTIENHPIIHLYICVDLAGLGILAICPATSQLLNNHDSKQQLSI